MSKFNELEIQLQYKQEGNSFEPNSELSAFKPASGAGADVNFVNQPVDTIRQTAVLVVVSTLLFIAVIAIILLLCICKRSNNAMYSNGKELAPQPQIEARKEVNSKQQNERLNNKNINLQKEIKFTDAQTSAQNDGELWNVNFSDKYMGFYQDGKIITDEAKMIYDKNLDGVMLVNSTLKNFNVKGKIWQNVDADGAKLVNSSMRNAMVYNTILRKANLHELRLDKTQLYDVDMSGASLSESVFNNSILYNVNFSKSQAQNLQMEDTFLQAVDFSGTDLTGAKFSNVAIKTLIFDKNTNWENVTCENAQTYDEVSKQFVKLPDNWIEICREATQQLRETNDSERVQLNCSEFKDMQIAEKSCLSSHVTRIDEFAKAICSAHDQFNELSKYFENPGHILSDKVSFHLSISTEDNKTLTCVPHVKDMGLSGPFSIVVSSQQLI